MPSLKFDTVTFTVMALPRMSDPFAGLSIVIDGVDDWAAKTLGAAGPTADASASTTTPNSAFTGPPLFTTIPWPKVMPKLAGCHTKLQGSMLKVRTALMYTSFYYARMLFRTFNDP